MGVVQNLLKKNERATDEMFEKIIRIDVTRHVLYLHNINKLFFPSK